MKDEPDINDTLRDEGAEGVRRRASRAKKFTGNGSATTPPIAPPFSDEALALAFAERHADELRYLAFRSKWLRWRAYRWEFDESLEAFDLSRAICRAHAAMCNRKKLAGMLTSARTVAAVERLAKADRRLATTDDEWDSEAETFTVPE